MNAPIRPSMPVRATYGEKDNMHTLLSCSGDGHALPATLAGFTDKPQGHLGPGECWWPSVGCGPFGDWWAIWWSVPDDRAARAGMARAEVALWPLEDVSEIDDLGEVMESLNGGMPVPAGSPKLLAAVAEALIRDSDAPLIADLQVWPSVLAGLWPRLWPAARREFSAWVTLSPPQMGDSKYIPWLYAVPSGREKQWPSNVIVNPLDTPTISRGARWLMGNSDATLDELLVECPFPDGSATHLNRIARAAERLDRVRSAPDAASGTELARTLAAIDPRPTGALQLKKEALRAVCMNLASSPLSAIRHLANLDATHFPADAMPSTALREWVSDQLPNLPPSDLEVALNVFLTGKAQPWWLTAFRDALREGLICLHPAWCNVMLFCLCNIPDLSTLSSNIVNSSELEFGVINAVASSQLTKEELQALRRATYTLGWSRLHATTVWRLLPSLEAIKEQLRFPVNPWDGAEVLLQEAHDEDVVRSAVELGDARLVSTAARLSIAKPILLRSMDLAVIGWRQLWVKHIAEGGNPWPSGIARDVEASKFLHAALTNQYQRGPIARLAPDFAVAALELPGRKKLWSHLDANEASLLVQETAKLLLKKLEQGEEFPQPELALSDAVLTQAEQIKFAAQTLLSIISWNLALEERAVRSWIRQVSLTGEVGRQIGKLIRDRHWNNTANDLYVRFITGEREVLTALSECRDQLLWWERIYVPVPGSAGSTAPTRDDLVRRAGELGGDLAATSLDDIWERAGGSVKVLLAHGTPAERWNQACRKANDGSLHGGLLALVNVLLADLPNNHQLVELLRELLRSSR
jgi:hypothetical protein